MRLVTKEEYFQNKGQIVQRVKNGALFVFPSDTTYRIGCDATNPVAVKKLRALKKELRPFTVMPPSKQWIREHCHVDEERENHLDTLPGRQMLFLDLKRHDSLPKETSLGASTVSVRIPRCWSHDVAMLAGTPIVSSSANIRGEHVMTSVEDIPHKLRAHLDFCLYDGTIDGKKVEIKDLTKAGHKW